MKLRLAERATGMTEKTCTHFSGLHLRVGCWDSSLDTVTKLLVARSKKLGLFPAGERDFFIQSIQTHLTPPILLSRERKADY
jgi:hypothetical protein